MKKKLFAAFLLTTALLLTLVPAVHAEERTYGTINIHLYNNTGAGAGHLPADGQKIPDPTSLGQPVPDVEFRVSEVKLAGDQTISNFTVGDARTFIANNATEYEDDTLYQQTISTDQNGEAKFPSSGHPLSGLPLGIYLVEEIAGGGSNTAINPFLVYLPLTLAGGSEDELIYDVHVYPKSQPLYIKKDGDEKAANVGDRVTWTIETSIPANIETLDLSNQGYYIIRDELDPRLNYVSTTVITSGGIELDVDSDYTLRAPDTQAPSYDGGGVVEVRMKDPGVSKLIAAQKQGESLRVIIVTEINDKALLNTDPSSSYYPRPEPIINSAELLYKNKDGDPENPDPGEETEEPPEVDITGLTVIKMDGENGKLLSGAVFELYRCADESNPNDPSNYKKVASGTTNDHGYIYWKFDPDFDEQSSTNTGISYGYYYVREIKAPDGYQLLSSISEIAALPDTGDIKGHIWWLSNYKLSGDFELPSTGGSGTTWYTVLGVCLIVLGAAFFLLAANRRRHRQGQ